MTPVGLRLHLTPDVLSKLVTAVAEKFRRFVRISRTENAGGFYEVDLRILPSYEAKEPKTGEGIHPIETVTVTREMVGELFDLLGIFPRPEETPATLAQAGPELQFISEKLEAIHGIVVELHDSVSGKCLEEVEDVLKAVSLAKHKMYLLLALSRAK